MAKKKTAAKKKVSTKAPSTSPKTRGRSPDKKNRVLELAAQNPNWGAGQIAEAAKCSTNYVYSVWRKKPKTAGGASKGSARSKSPVTQHLEHVRALRGVILHVGIDQAKALMDQIVKDLMV